MSEIVLASGSATRLSMLRDAGVDVSVEKPQVDEASIIESLVAEKARPRDIADLLAEMKAVKVSGRRSGAFAIGADQVLSVESQVVQKATDMVEAKRQLLMLRGKTHVLSSAVCVARDGSAIWREVREARLTMRDFSEAFLDSYLAQAGEDILGSVGAYQVERLGIQLFSRIEGDHFTILGLPLISLLDFLRVQGLLKA